MVSKAESEGGKEGKERGKGRGRPDPTFSLVYATLLVTKTVPVPYSAFDFITFFYVWRHLKLLNSPQTRIDSHLRLRKNLQIFAQFISVKTNCGFSKFRR